MKPTEPTSSSSLGIVRKVDHLGRVVLPIEIRRTFNLENDDSVEIFVEGDTIILKRWEAACVFCGRLGSAKVYKEKVICEECYADLVAGRNVK